MAEPFTFKNMHLAEAEQALIDCIVADHKTVSLEDKDINIERTIRKIEAIINDAVEMID